ncbi:hypothetical protein M9H77_13132 [Catharanthus roseus]|uniref:Uncharacterized protein n=1 Tax=Catharanthus roseus TaxID=4058 RepID=A0ACC0BJG5_CATRO|nr:hypothetical protein M9H77_13132 [Catharanthus roseus]
MAAEVGEKNMKVLERKEGCQIFSQERKNWLPQEKRGECLNERLGQKFGILEDKTKFFTNQKAAPLISKGQNNFQGSCSLCYHSLKDALHADSGITCGFVRFGKHCFQNSFD